MDERAIFEQYRDFTRLIDKETARVAGLHGSAIRCRKGCRACCDHFSLLPIEAEVVRQAFLLLPATRQKRIIKQAEEEEILCPFLEDNLCVIYENRPLVCRTQGLPLGYVDDDQETIEVSACQQNFPDNYSFSPENLLLMPPLIARLRELNWAHASLVRTSPWRRILVRSVILAASSLASIKTQPVSVHQGQE